MMPEPRAIHLGITEYKSTWDLQRRLVGLRSDGKIADTLLLNEHYHVYTVGKSGNDDHLLANDEELRASGADVFHIDRGGDITYHGPGQLVVYPILDLHGYYLDIHRYLRDLEEVIILTLAESGIIGTRDEKYTGVWVGNEKIAAVGIKVSRWITMHGFALNVRTNLEHFDRIIPCGIFHKGVTSMECVLGKAPGMEEVGNSVVRQFNKVFGRRFLEEQPEQFLSTVQHLSLETNECHQTVSL